MLGAIDPAEDVAQLPFERDLLMLGANVAYVFFGDPAAAPCAPLDSAPTHPCRTAATVARARRANVGASSTTKAQAARNMMPILAHQLQFSMVPVP